MKAFLFLLLVGAAVAAGWYYYPIYRPFLPNKVGEFQIPGAAPAFVPPDPLPKKEDWTWTTTTGKIYHKVQIVKVEADCVTILHSNGGARIDTSTLPPDLQRQLNYNEAQAQEAASERSDDTAYSKEKMAEETTAIQSNAMNDPTPPINMAPAVVDSNAALKFQIDDAQAHYNDCLAKADAAQKAYDAETISTAFGTARPAVSKDAQAYRDAAAQWKAKLAALKAQLAAGHAQPTAAGGLSIPGKL